MSPAAGPRPARSSRRTWILLAGIPLLVALLLLGLLLLLSDAQSEAFVYTLF